MVWVAALLLAVVQACNLPKLARKEGPFLYKNTLTVAEKKESRNFSSDLDAFIKQNPNKRFLGIARFGLRYYVFGSHFPNTTFGRFLQTKAGDAPVILDSSLIEVSIKGMKAFLRTQGYYAPEITYKVSGRIHRKKVHYEVTAGKAYHIYKKELHVADRRLHQLLEEENELSHLRLGNRLVFENLLKEKNRIADLYRNNGYFSFNKDMVSFDIDTMVGNFHAMVGTQIKNPGDFDRFRTYKIGTIALQVDQEADSALINSKTFVEKNFTFRPGSYPLHPEILERVILLEPGRRYNQEMANATFTRLSELQIFRTVNMTAIPLFEKSDTPAVDYQIKLQPKPKYDITFEPQAITSDQSNLVTGSTGRNYGFASQLTFTNRNVFHRAEVLQLSYRASIEAQRGAGISASPFFNSFESNLTATLIFPKLLFLSRTDRRWSNSVNRSLLSATTIWEQNVNWIRSVYALGFSWQRSRKYFNQNFTPMELSYINTRFNNSSLETQSKSDPYLQSVFNNNLVTSSRFSFVFNNQTDPRKKNFIYIRWDVLELAGNFIDFSQRMLGFAPGDSGFRTVLGVQYFQYAKTYADLRYNHYLDENDRLAGRLAIGVAIPYGNSPDYIPFDKRFFTGGANSIRAFLPRSIGPGGYNAAGNLDRSGDLRLEASVELRFNLFNHFLEGAVFTDAGNIWRVKDDGRAEATFQLNTFYRQLALGSGLGIRLNLDFLVLRVDAAIPILDPRLPAGNRNLLSTYTSPSTIFRNTVFNFGVGYPF